MAGNKTLVFLSWSFTVTHAIVLLAPRAHTRILKFISLDTVIRNVIDLDLEIVKKKYCFLGSTVNKGPCPTCICDGNSVLFIKVKECFHYQHHLQILLNVCNTFSFS